MDIKTTQTRTPQTAENKPGPPATVPHVVIVGGGFAGLTAAKKLEKQPVRITMIDRTNYHLFQPMLYQVATTALAPTDIASPLRGLLRRENTDFLMAEVTGVDTQQQLVWMKDDQSVHYDYLILATGANTNYFNHPEWEELARSMKTLDDAVTIKNATMLALEAAEREPDEEKRKALLTVVLVGGGPTGCELAAMMAEHRRGFKAHFQHVSPKDIRIVLVEHESRLMASFHPTLSKKVQQHLTELGVEIRTGVAVNEVNDEGVRIGDEFLATKGVVWVAGVKASPAGQWLHAEVDHHGRVKVQNDLSVPGLPNIFVVGDTALTMQKGKALPGLAQPAIQEGHYVASVIAARIAGKGHPQPFKYFDKGSLAIVGRTYAVFESGPIHLAGSLAWLIWLFVHIYFLIGFRNRLFVFLKYAWAYFTPFEQSSGARIIFRGYPVRQLD